MMRRIFTSLMLCLSILGHSITYYVSPGGNDSNNGTSAAQAWRTIARVQQNMNNLQPGDQVLFERGGTYSGTLDISRSGTSSQPLVFGAYGSGDDPIISGGVPVTNWVQHSGNIWRASLATAPKYVIVNDQPMELARYPNTGWLRNQNGSTTHLSSPQLNQSSGYWNGATVVVRTTNYSYEKSTVTSSSNGRVDFQPIWSNVGNEDWGFFLCGKLSQLDMAGEWYHDAATGQLYLWAPNNANPNNLSVYASIHAKGVVPGWQKSHMRIENLTIQGQTQAAISVEVSNNVTITNCQIRFCYLGVSSSGFDNKFINNNFNNTFASAMEIYDTAPLIEGNIFNDIAVRAGMGQDHWGYWAVRTTGSNAVVRNNRLNNIGYIGIGVSQNALVEHNVVVNATSILNDGAGITFDNCDGVIVRDNIVKDCLGNLESVATQHIIYYPICFGIYFGNQAIKNTVVQRNTVTRCNGAGIHVDHTMANSGNQVKDNILFDNSVQMSISDFSNYMTPGASAPYYVANFNTVYSGNVMYSLKPDQLCMRQFHVHSAQHTDFGTFTNNRYFNPYEEMSIMIRNSLGGYGGTQYYTLERWQNTWNEDAGSTRSPLRSNLLSTISELSGDLITNGTFDQPVNNWTIFPANGQATLDHTYLDGSAMKVNLPSADLYSGMNLRSPDQFSMQNGQWYRMRLSVQSDIIGVMTPAIKGLSQMSSTATIGRREIPFSNERRDMEFYFQSSLSDQAILQFSHSQVFPRYWVDNVQLHRVNVQPVDPAQDHVLLYNEFSMTQEFSLPSGCWKDVDNNVVNGSISLQPYRSKVIYRVTGSGCNTPVASSVGAKVLLGGALTSNGTMRTDLRTQNLLPTTEPYSAMGLAPENAGQTISSAVMQATGSQAIVDWVLVELRNADAGHTLAARRAALVRANGEVITPDGAVQIPFNTATQGRHVMVKHRNHLGAMTASPLSSNAQVVDFTTSNTSTFGSSARMTQGSQRALWPGDVNADGKVSYTNADNDRDLVLVAIGSVIPSNTTTGYLPEDVNLDGIVKYTGANNDRDIILTTIGGVVPTAIKLAQLP